MKKLFTLFCLVAAICTVNAQSSNKQLTSLVSSQLKLAPSLVKNLPHAHTNRAASYSLLLDYDGNDNQYSTNMGYDYKGYLWEVNSKYSNTDNLTLRYAAVFYDTLQYIDGNNNLAYYPRSSSTLTLDSFVVGFIHDHVTSNPDSIRFTVYNTNAAVVTGYGTSAATFTTPKIWDTLIVTNSTIPLNTTNYTFLTFAPNISLPQGQTFGVRVDFKGDTAISFYLFMLLSFLIDCG